VRLTSELSESYAALALSNVGSEYPYKLDQLLTAPADLRAPASLHPVFWGCYDWHSCVHMHWTLARLLRLMPNHGQAAATAAHFEQRFTTEAIEGEFATLSGPHHRSFERPYGWGWLLKLAAELTALAQSDPRAARWHETLAPLAHLIAGRFLDFLPRADFPTRAGTHGNSAFALTLALDWCDQVQHRALAQCIHERAQRWYGRDRRYPAAYEPGGDDFLAAGLIEAVLMQRIVDDCSYSDWWHDFEPPPAAMANWLAAVPVADPTDPKIVHLHGVNLTRAWCWGRLLPVLPLALQDAARTAIEGQLAASVGAAGSGDYVGTHWLASFVLLALTDVPAKPATVPSR
jgi:hypothetical protein